MLARLKGLLRRPIAWVMIALGVGAVLLLRLRGGATAAGVPKAAATAPDAGLTSLDMLPAQPLNLSGQSGSSFLPGMFGMPAAQSAAQQPVVIQQGAPAPATGVVLSQSQQTLTGLLGQGQTVDDLRATPGAYAGIPTSEDPNALIAQGAAAAQQSGLYPGVDVASQMAAMASSGYSPDQLAYMTALLQNQANNQAAGLYNQPPPPTTGHGGGGEMTAWDVAPHGAASDPADVGRDYLDMMGRAGLVPRLRPSRKGSKMWGDLVAAEALAREGYLS